MAHMKSITAGLEALKEPNIAYKVGSKVPESGIYAVIHRNKHKKSHEVTCIKGAPFPPCRNCGKDVEFRLVRAAIHIDRDNTFK
jgi:hypothetical protein